MAYAPTERTDLSALHLQDRHTALGLSGDEVVAMWRTILLTRRLDQKIWALNRMGKAPFAVSCQGHEGAQIGSAWALRGGTDVVCPYYRDTGVMVALGMTAREIMEAVFAREADPNSGGRQMPNHWGSSRLRVITGSSPIATHIPHAAGIALAAKMRGEDTAVVCYFGDGAASKGDFHEAMNFAAVHKLPVVFVIENNLLAISTRVEQQMAVPNVADKAAGYGVRGFIADGMDVLDSYDKTRQAVEHTRSGAGPTLVELKCYRFQPHTSDDDDTRYRTKDEVRQWMAKDPVDRTRKYLREHGTTAEELEAIRHALDTEIEAAIAQAESEPDPRPEDAMKHVYAEEAPRPDGTRS